MLDLLPQTQIRSGDDGAPCLDDGGGGCFLAQAGSGNEPFVHHPGGRHEQRQHRQHMEPPPPRAHDHRGRRRVRCSQRWEN